VPTPLDLVRLAGAEYAYLAHHRGDTMISLLTGLLVPPADNAVRVFLGTTAFALGWNGIDPLVNWCVTETSSFISREISAARKSSLDLVAFAVPLRPRPGSSLRSLNTGLLQMDPRSYTAGCALRAAGSPKTRRMTAKSSASSTGF
jgi:hypothetical protein